MKPLGVLMVVVGTAVWAWLLGSISPSLLAVAAGLLVGGAFVLAGGMVLSASVVYGRRRG